MSNKTPTEQPEKTASAHKKRLTRSKILYFILAVFLILLAVGWGVIIVNKGDLGCDIQIIDNYRLDEPHGKYSAAQPGTKCLRLERVNAPQELKKGLSGRKSIPEHQGMLFTFETPGMYCFWMRDMNFPIDIIWLDSEKRVVTVKENLKPETYPDNFCPDTAAQYVIEVNTGIARKALISEGSQLRF